MPHGKGVSVRTRLYLEGRHIPNGMQNVMVAGNEGAPLTAQISLTPTNAIKHIMPGTEVKVFSTDPWELNPRGDLSDFKLLFDGIVVGRGVSREDTGRAFTIQCADPSISWVEARQYWLNLTSSGGGLVEQVAIQTSLGAGRFGTIASNAQYGYLVSRMSSIQESEQERFLDTLLAVIDEIGNVNPYYANIRNRFRITDRIVRAHCGKVEKLFQLALLSDYLTGLSNRVSGQSNLAECVNAMLEPILHGWASLPAPPYVTRRIFQRDAFGNIIRKATPSKIPGVPSQQLFSYEMATEKVIAGTFFKPDCYALSPPTCNVLFPNMYDGMKFQQDFMQEPTRVIMRPSLIGKAFESINSTGMLLMRPTELEMFTQLTRDSKAGTQPGPVKKREPDARYANNKGESQSPTYSDYDWGTNEERIRGIVPNFINMSPAPATLTMSDPGARQPDGTRSGGMPMYLQNVASYEAYKARFATRPLHVQGLYNMRPVIGFPILAVDDSAANMTVIGQLRGIVHTIDARGSATTEYTITHGRMVDEVDYNQPKFTGGTDPKNGNAILELAVDSKGQFDFGRLFSGTSRPPIPEWFSDDYRTLEGLDQTYAAFFGDNVRVLESVLFEKARAASAASDLTSTVGAALGGAAGAAVAGAASSAAGKAAGGAQSAALVAINSIDQAAAAAEMASLYSKARSQNREFELAASTTARSMARIDEAFLFMGAAPIEYVDTPASKRKIDYVKAKLDTFVGDVTAGYAAAQDAGGTPAPTRMSGAFPDFETKIHTGDTATDKAKRDAAVTGESGTSVFPRYDGRPVMFDFEYRLWQASLAAAKQSSSANAGDTALQGAARYTSGPNGTAVPTSPQTIASAAPAMVAAQAKKAKADKAVKQTLAPTADQQAPTGAAAQNSPALPLPQPLSERQIVDIRRAVIAMYMKELEDSRGQSG